MIRSKLLSLLILAFSSLFASGSVLSASPAQSFAETPDEAAMCSVIIYGGKDRDFKIRTEGQANWLHMHHFCDCIRFRYRALRNLGNTDAVRGNIRTAVGGCDYVIERATPDFHMLPQIHLEKGRALRVGGDPAGAARAFMRSIELNPATADAYLELASLQATRGNRSEALETITLGLKNVPASTALQNRYLELGGRKPFPEPVARRTSDQAQELGRDARQFDEEKSGHDNAEEGTDDGVKAGQGGDSVSRDEDGISPQGCRFCPPEEIQRKWRESFGERPQK